MIKVIAECQKAYKQCTCTNCGAVLEYTNADTTTRNVADYGGGSDTYRFVDCPRCKNEINVKL